MHRKSEYGLLKTITYEDGSVEKEILLGKKRPVTLPYACRKMKEAAEAYAKETGAPIGWPRIPLSWSEYVATEPGVMPKVEWSIAVAGNIDGKIKIDWDRYLKIHTTSYHGDSVLCIAKDYESVDIYYSNGSDFECEKTYPATWFNALRDGDVPEYADELLIAIEDLFADGVDYPESVIDYAVQEVGRLEEK